MREMQEREKQYIERHNANAMHTKFCPPMVSHADHLREDIMEQVGKT